MLQTIGIFLKKLFQNIVKVVCLKAACNIDAKDDKQFSNANAAVLHVSNMIKTKLKGEY